MNSRRIFCLIVIVCLTLWVSVLNAELRQPANTWVKRSPLPDTPVSPRLGYEGACVWDNAHRVLIRYGGHNQGGGGAQYSEIWTFDPLTARWTLKEPNTSPPGVCCAQQNVYDPIRARYVRFPAFSGNHGWQWFREIYLNNSTVWTYDLKENLWRDLRPLPAPHVSGLRCASWDSDAEVIVVFGGEGNHEGTVIYDPYANTWTRMNPPTQPPFRSGGNMVYDSRHKVHVLFGSQFTDDPHTWLYDPGRNQWRDPRPAQLPPTNENDAVLAYDSRNGVVIALVKVSRTQQEEVSHRIETWVYDVGANIWKKMNPPREPDVTGNRSRVLSYAPELGLTILENRTRSKPGPPEQQIWTYCYDNKAAAGESPLQSPSAKKERTRPPVVEDVVITVLSKDKVRLDWKPLRKGDVVGYHIERACVEVWSEDQLKRLKSKVTPLANPSVGAVKRIGPFVRLASRAISGATFADEVDLATPCTVSGEAVYEHRLYGEHLDLSGRPYAFGVYAYRIRAVNASGAEGGPSPYVLTIPSAPQWVFARDDDGTCRIKWAKNRERNLKGYRVYRLDGRWEKDSITRLTDEPVAGLRYSDSTAGTAIRRYYVVAVDVLGQEGAPSAPVWYNREWKRFYEPFTGTWHQ